MRGGATAISQRLSDTAALRALASMPRIGLLAYKLATRRTAHSLHIAILLRAGTAWLNRQQEGLWASSMRQWPTRTATQCGSM